MKEKHFNNWQKIRAKGRLRFLLLRGILGWGLPMFLIMTFVFYGGEDSVLTSVSIGIHALIWTFGGLIFGQTMWHLSEKKYSKEIERRKGQSK